MAVRVLRALKSDALMRDTLRPVARSSSPRGPLRLVLPGLLGGGGGGPALALQRSRVFRVTVLAL